MSRIFLSHSSKDLREAVALKKWLADQDATLAEEIFLDVDGLLPGMRWRDALRRAHTRCEAVICLLSRNWEESHECRAEFRTAENLNKQILCARIEPSAEQGVVSEWQRCDLFGTGPKTQVDIGDGTPVEFATDGLLRLRDAIGEAGIGPESFPWPPPDDPDRAPYRGWQPLEHADAAVFFGRDTAIVQAMDAIRGMRLSGLKSLMVVLGPSGTGKSSFLRAGLLPRLAREDRRFVLLDIVRPERNAMTGETGLAKAIATTRKRYALDSASLGEIKKACTGGDVGRIAQNMSEIREAAAAQLLEDYRDGDIPSPPTLILPLDQAEELFSADAGEQAEQFIAMLRDLTNTLNSPDSETALIVLGTIRTDRYEVMQTHPALSDIEALVFDELKPMPVAQFTEVITGPAKRATKAGFALHIAPELRDRLLHDVGQGADTLPMLSLTLSRLHADYGSTGVFTIEQYESMGGMRQIVQTEIDAILASDPERRQQQLQLLRAAFIPWLATINPENDQPLRRVSRYVDLPEASRPLIDALVAKRLMVKGTRDGEVVVEVALESLLRQWDELAGWLTEERQDLLAADDLERTATAWRASDHDGSWLLAGNRLTDAETLVAQPGFRQRLAPTHDYLGSSRETENARLRAEEERREAELRSAQERQAEAEAYSATLRKRSRILRGVLAMTVVIAVAAVVGFGFALKARGQAEDRFRQATSVRLASESQGILDGGRPGSDARAVQQLLAANALAPGSFDDFMHATAAKTFNTDKVIEAGEPLIGMDVSPDGRRLVTSGQDSKLRMWDVESGQPVEPTFEKVDGYVSSVAFSPDGGRIASASDDLTVRIWDADTGEQIGAPLVGHGDEVWTVAFSPDGKTIASGGVDATVRLWNADTGQPIGQPLRGHTAEVQFVEFSPDGQRLVSAGDTSVRMWDVASGQQIGDPFISEPKDAYAAVFSPDGSRMATANADGLMRLWDTRTGTPMAPPMPGHESSVNSIAFSSDGQWIATGGGDGVLRLWDGQTGQPRGAPMASHENVVWRVVFSPDGSQLISAGEDGTIHIWNLGVAQPLAGHVGPVSEVAVSADGRRIASGGVDGTTHLWDAESGREVVPPLVSDGRTVSSVAISGDGLLAVGSEDATVRFWDVGNGEPRRPPLDTGLNELRSITFSPDGDRLATAGDNFIRLWDVASAEPIGDTLIHNELVHGIAFSPDGRFLASVGEIGSNYGTLKVWDTKSGQLVKETPRDPSTLNLYAVTYSPDGSLIASAGTDGAVDIRDARTLALVGVPFDGHTDSIKSLSFSPDGRVIASASRDKSIRLWNVESGEQVTDAFTGHAEDVFSVAFSPDGRRVVSGSDDGTVRAWPAAVTPDDLCAKLTANMSREQWNESVTAEIDYVTVCPDLPIAPK